MCLLKKYIWNFFQDLSYAIPYFGLSLLLHHFFSVLFSWMRRWPTTHKGLLVLWKGLQKKKPIGLPQIVCLIVFKRIGPPVHAIIYLWHWFIFTLLWLIIVSWNATGLSILSVNENRFLRYHTQHMVCTDEHFTDENRDVLTPKITAQDCTLLKAVVYLLFSFILS